MKRYNLYYIFLEDKQQRALSAEAAARLDSKILSFLQENRNK